MVRSAALLALTVSVGFFAAPAAAQSVAAPAAPGSRGAADPPTAFLEAVAAGTRTLEGLPGPAYWQNGADYVI
jgi:hypothetical protein